MLSLYDAARCNELILHIRDRLMDNEHIDVVPRHLYLHKNGTWSQRYEMTECDIGTPDIEKLLWNFVFATSGIEISPEQLKSKGPLVLGELLNSLEETLFRLQSIQTA